MNLSQLQEDLNSSLKAGKTVRVGAIRFLISAVRNAAITKYGALWETSLKEEDVLDVVKKQVKTHKESVEAFEKAGRVDLADKEKQELEVLADFAPKEMGDHELKKLLEPVVASGEKNFGLVMKNAMGIVAGRADGGRVSALLKQMLQ